MLMIRSQNGEVIVPLTCPIFIQKDLTSSMIVFGNAADAKIFLLGKYSSESRCMEIMDEIMMEFQYSNHFSGSGISRQDCQNWEYGVYIMPRK